MKFVAYNFFVAVLVFGCIRAPHSVTIEEELVQTFGSYEKACEATMTIIPDFLGKKALPTELRREDRLQVLETLRGCMRYEGKDAEESADLNHNGFRCGLRCSWLIKIESKDKEYIVEFAEVGFLYRYLCPDPDSVMSVNRMLKYCVEECVTRCEEVEGAD